MNKNFKGNERPRDDKGRFISVSAIYSSKHNVVDLEKGYEEKMEFWRKRGLAKSDNFFRPFEYRAEAFKIPSDYYYTADEVKTRLGEYDNYILEMSNLSEVNINEPESVLSVAKLVTLKGDSMRNLYIKNTLCEHEGLTLVSEENLNKDSDFYVPITVKPEDTKDLFQAVVAKKKLIDLVVDTYYKLDFNKSIRTHYTFNNRIDEDSSIYICRYHSSPISIFGHDNVSAIIFKKTDFDEDGDRIILTNPEPIFVLIKRDYGFLAIDLIIDTQQYPVVTLDGLDNLVPNLMIPEEMLRELSKKDTVNNLNVTPATNNPIPSEKCDLEFGVTVNVQEKDPIGIALLDEDNNTKEFISTYRLGEFRSPRKVGYCDRLIPDDTAIKCYRYATGPNDLWILIDENLDKIYFYNVYYDKIVDWCLATTSDFLNLLNMFSSKLLSEEVKGDLVESMNNILKNYYSEGIISSKKNEGLFGFLKTL